MNIRQKLAALTVAIAAATAAIAAPASAHGYGPAPAWGHGHHSGSGWDLIGTREVRHFAESDRVFAQGPRKYSQVRICAYHRPIHLYDLDVVFRNGGHQDVSVRSFLQPGECTRAVDLFGYRRDIRFVNMAYETAGRDFGPRAVVRVFAR